MALDGHALLTDPKEPVVPDVKGLGLKDAMFMIENSGLNVCIQGPGM